jgi:ABC-2 type transport system ATP-binding protein
MTENILSLNSISKSYGRIKALKEVSFQVPKGSVFGILGPNGSGKTTMLGIVLDALKPDDGIFHWFNGASSPESRKKIGSLLETPNFYHYLSAVDNLKITQAINERGTLDDIHTALEVVKLSERKYSKFSTYSLGMKQRLAIGAALLAKPEVIVFDEPTNGLDPVGILEIRELIKSLSKQGTTIIMASHLLDEVEKVCTHVAIMKKGTLVASGSVDEVLRNEDIVEIGASHPSKLVSLFDNYPHILDKKLNGDYVQLFLKLGTANLEAINKHCFDNGVTLNHLLLKKKSLEAKFFELTN